MLYSYILSCYILVRMIDAADPEKLIFQKSVINSVKPKKNVTIRTRSNNPSPYISNAQKLSKKKKSRV